MRNALRSIPDCWEWRVLHFFRMIDSVVNLLTLWLLKIKSRSFPQNDIEWEMFRRVDHFESEKYKKKCWEKLLHISMWGAFQNNVRNCTFLLKIRPSWTASRSTVLVAEIPKYMHILSQRKKFEVIRASYHDFRATYIRRNASGGKSQPQAQCPDELRSKNSYRQEGEFRKIENFVFAPDTSLLQDSVL